jgi:hypothetical protein
MPHSQPAKEVAVTEMPELVEYRTIRPDVSLIASAEVGTPEAVVTAMYDAISGPAERDQERDWRRFRALALPGARFLIGHGWDAHGNPVPDLREWDLEGFIADAKRAYRWEGFWEREIWGNTESFGNIAHRFSSYESRVGSEESEPVARGINSIQLVRSGDRWWLASVVWDVESEVQPIPPEYLVSERHA